MVIKNESIKQALLEMEERVKRNEDVIKDAVFIKNKLRIEGFPTREIDTQLQKLQSENTRLKRVLQGI